MSLFDNLLGAGGVAEQMFVWGVLQNVVQALMQPYFVALQNAVATATPDVPLSAPDAAHAVVRSYMDQAAGEAEAAKAGIDAARFAVMRDLAGNAPSPEQLVEALRRKLIPADGSGPGSTSFTQGIAETNLLDKWTDVIKGLASIWPSPADIVDATVESQVTPDEGKAMYEQVGGDPQWFSLLVGTRGNPPSPTEALTLAMRGIIPWDGTGQNATTFQQAIYEGATKDKWEPFYKQLAYYWPTVSEINELYRYGQLTRDQAAARLAQRGVSGTDAAAFLGYAEVNAIDDYRGLTQSTVLDMVSAGYTSDDQATTMLQALHVGPAAVTQLLAYAHLQRAITRLNNSIDRIGNLYAGRKITRDTAQNSLVSMKIGATAVQELLQDWDAINSVNVKTLTETQIIDAWSAQIMTLDEALTELENIGYTPYDAWVLLSYKNKKPLPNKPAQGPAPPQGTVVPGTT